MIVEKTYRRIIAEDGNVRVSYDEIENRVTLRVTDELSPYSFLYLDVDRARSLLVLLNSVLEKVQ